MKLRFFVSHKFVRDGQMVSLLELRSLIERVVKRASQGRGDFDCEIYYEDSDYGEPLPISIRSRIQACHIFCCDLSAYSPNVLYELGFAHALKKKLLVLLEDTKESRIPADIADLSVARYSSKEGFEICLQDRVSSLVNEFVDLNRAAMVEPDFRCEWFTVPTDISIICSPEPEKSRFADPTSNAYIFVDNMEDRDALIEVSMYLSRAFPDVGIQRHISDAIAHDILDSNLVLLGGQKNNVVTRDFLRILSIDLKYDLDGMTLTLPTRGSVTIGVKHSDDGLVVEDAGYFGLFANPFRKGKRVAICVGSHTFGTLAATKALGDSFQGLKNTELVRGLAAAKGFSMRDSIQALFPVTVMMNRKVVTPILDPTKIWFG
ncbi:hypothetical protein ACFY2Q_29350 [Micromonospora sp. NPDC000316]|uniref:hypothetical protein n=1 Tax=Micromonospora sp. NPDC000316 TaxID=3364216 RepID=UPI0036B8FA0C